MSDPRNVVNVLDVDPDLADGIPAGELELAHRSCLAGTVALRDARWDPTIWIERGNRDWLGLMVVEGLLVRRVSIGSRSACELFGPGDLVRPWDADGEYAPFPIELEWQVKQLGVLAVLDSVFAQRIARWPSITARIIGSVAKRARHLALMQAITHLTRVTDRVLIVFWLLAERWGRVGTDGIRISLPLNHQLIGMLVGAQRPTVTVALGRLAQAELLVRERRHAWLLTNEAVRQLESAEALTLLDLEL